MVGQRISPISWKTWLAAPHFPEDKRKDFQAALLNSLTLSLWAIMIIVLVFTSLVSSAKLFTNSIVLFNIFILLVCKVRLNRGHIAGIKYVLPALLWLNSTLLVVWAGGTANISMIYYIITAVFVTLLFGKRGAVVIFIVTSLASLAITLAEIQGWLPERVFLTPPLNSWLILMLGIIISSITISLAIDSRDKALAALSESEAKYRALFEAESNATIVLEDGNGVILDVNSAAAKLYGYQREEMIGKNILEISTEPEDTFRAIQGEALHIPLRYHKRRDGSVFPAEIRDNITYWGGKRVRIGNIRDISDRLQAEQRERRISQHLGGIIAAAEQLIRCETPDDVYRRAVELGRSELSLERCALFLLDEAKENLLGIYGTDDLGQTTDEHAARIFLPEVDRVSDKSVKTWHVHYDSISHWEGDHAVHTQEHWTAATYIHSTTGPIGVFFNDANISHTPIDRSQQETVAVYCSLLGSIIEQKHAEARRQRVGEGLRAIISATDELARCEDLNNLYHRAVELAQQKLGAERCALFIYDSDNGVMRGTYGVDIAGNIVSEAAISWETDFQHEMEISSGKTWYLVQGEYRNVVGNHWEVVGHGWVVHMVMRLGEEPIGMFVNDSAISLKPLDPLQQELLAIYCSLLENMIKQKQSETALRRAALTLRVSEERYRQAIEAAGAVPYLQDYVKKAFTFIGENIFQLTGYSAEEMTPIFWDTLVEEAIPGGEASGLSELDAIPLARSGKLSQWLCDYRIRTRVGESRWIMDSAVEIFDEHGIARGSIGILQDITVRKQAEAERERLIAELETKNAELERFTYTVSHDLKSPLITIQGFLGYLQKDAEQGNLERLRADMARITDATVRMQHLLNDLLELSRIGRIVNPPKHIPFSLIVDEALSLVKGRLDRGSVQVTVADDLPFVYGDSARLVEVVQNLVDNAAKFMEGQKNPHIEIGWRESNERGFHIFYVHDNGIGVPPQYHERIFGLFNKLDAKSEGTGVGLALVKRIIEVHGGRIWVESGGIGSGSTFYFSLPNGPVQQ
jgi:PAS domain S-box-containing protein